MFRTSPGANPDVVRSLTALNALLAAAVANSVTADQLSKIASAARELKPRMAPDARLQAAFDSLEQGITNSQQRLETLKNQRGSAGVVFSACSIRRDNNRRVSINATFRLLNSYGERKAQYAGGNEIQLAMFVPAVAWRPLADFEWIDVVDLSTGGGVYWFSSEAGQPGAFESFRGVVLEPARIDFHFPSGLAKEGWPGAILAGVSYRRGWAIFPHGFAANAFGTTRTPPQAQQIGAEWVKTSAIFWDFAPLIHYATRNK